ncbi:TraU family protein, partial [Escherichia coli]|nr:TIGR03756 family integrating conjugative element protein [Escherichia coli]
MMTLKSRLRACVLLLSVASLPLASASLNTASIIASAAAPDCISWRVSGICYWLYCSASGCTVRTSVKVTHFIPEVVISTYTAPGGNPWKEMSLVSRTAGGPENAITDGLSGLSAGGGNPA